MVNVKHVIMRDQIRQIVVQAIAGTTDLTKAIDQLCDLHNVSGSLCDNPHCEDGIIDYCPYYKTPIYCQCCEQGDR